MKRYTLTVELIPVMGETNPGTPTGISRSTQAVCRLSHAIAQGPPRRCPGDCLLIRVRHRTGPAHEPRPVSVQRKEHNDAEALYQQIRQALESSQPRLLELTCEKVEGKKVTLLISEILAVQLYEKASATGGSKRPGFSLDG